METKCVINSEIQHCIACSLVRLGSVNLLLYLWLLLLGVVHLTKIVPSKVAFIPNWMSQVRWMSLVIWLSYHTKYRMDPVNCEIEVRIKYKHIYKLELVLKTSFWALVSEDEKSRMTLRHMIVTFDLWIKASQTNLSKIKFNGNLSI